MEELKAAARKVVGTKQVLRALKAGTVTVTVTAGVDGEAITDTITIKLVEDSVLPDGNFSFEFTYGKVVDLEHATLEEILLLLVKGVN